MAGAVTGSAEPAPDTSGGVPTRELGKTGVRVSMLGLGGSHIGKKLSEEQSIRLIRRAVDNGITFLDNCWDYNEGASETRMGKALRDGYRENAFLMTKIDGRSKKEAARQLDESLQRFVSRDEGFNFFDRVNHRRVMFAAKRTTDLRIAVFGQMLAQIHRDLSWV